MTMLTPNSSTYDVLLLESHPRVGELAAIELTAAGHRIHRCHRDRHDFPCAVLVDGERCPIDAGIDVAVLVRRPFEPLPTQRETGATCARRAGIPIVEQGPAELDPWEPWIQARVDPDSPDLALVTAGIAGRVDAPAESAIRRTLAPLLQAARIDPTAVGCSLERTGSNVAVHITLPEPADRSLRSAISVRVLDGLRAAATKTLGNVNVYVHPSLESSDG